MVTIFMSKEHFQDLNNLKELKYSANDASKSLSTILSNLNEEIDSNDKLVADIYLEYALKGIFLEGCIIDEIAEAKKLYKSLFPFEENSFDEFCTIYPAGDNPDFFLND